MKNWKIVFWAVLFVLSVIALLLALTSERKINLPSAAIAVVFTGWWLIAEIRNNKQT